MDTHPDPYELLGLPPGASRPQIRRRYRELLRAHHPDVASDPASAHEYAVALGAAYRAAMRQAPAVRSPEVEDRAPDPELRRAVEDAAPWSSVPGHLLQEAEALVRRGRYVEAQVLCAEALLVDPDSAAAHRLLAAVYAGLGLAAEAKDELAEAELLERMGPAPFRPAAVAARPRAREARAEGAGESRGGPSWAWLFAGAVCAGGCLAAALGGAGPRSPWLGAPASAVGWSMGAACLIMAGWAAAGREPSPRDEVRDALAWRGAWPVALALAALLWPALALFDLAVRLVGLQTLRTWLAMWSTVCGVLLLVGLTHGAAPIFWWLGGNAITLAALLGRQATSRLAGAGEAPKH
jgi:tetratricopeptide (TPR) repeat protein